MRVRPLSILVLPALAAPSAMAGDRNLTGAPLEWRPTTRLSESMDPLNLMPFAGVKIWMKPFADTRPDKAIIGENREKEEVRTVSTKDDAAAFLGQHAAQLLKEAGLPMADKAEEGTVLLSADVLRFKVTEDKTYKGELSLLLEVRAHGRLLWKGTATGTATRWGRSFKLENYHEALSDSLIDALAKVFKSQDFMNALAGKGAAAR